MVRACSIARALDVVGEKWSLLAVREVFLGSFKFNEIQENTGAPKDILSDRLRKLVHGGVMERVPYHEHPPRYEYRLTPMGRDLFAAITALREWGDRHCGDPPRAFRHKCGAVVETKLVCRSCGQEVTERNIRSIESSETDVSDDAHEHCLVCVPMPVMALRDDEGLILTNSSSTPAAARSASWSDE